jgi:hypothetical protein
MTNQSMGPQGASASSPQWLTDLNDAIQSGDDLGLWRLLDQHRDPVEAHHRLVRQVARLAYKVGDHTRFSEMFLVPIIEYAGTQVLDEDVVWRAADHCIGEALNIWLAPKTRKTVFAGIRPYDWIGTWRPGVLQCHLHSTVPGRQQKQVQFLTETIDCPAEAPRLGFICMVLTGERGWPQLPPADTLRDNRFKSVLSFALQKRDGAAGPMVLTPDRVQFAVTDGLCLWLHMVSQAVPIIGWSAAPLAASPDVVKITLAFEHDEVPHTQFTVRKHQVGLEGLECVLSMLREIAPMLDTPMDLPRSRKISRTLALT